MPFTRICPVEFGCEKSGEMQVTSASTRFEMMGVTAVRVPTAHRLYVPMSTDCCRDGAYNCSGNLYPCSFRRLYIVCLEGDRYTSTRTITPCVCSSIFVGGSDRVAKVQVSPLSVWLSRYGHFVCFALSSGSTFSCCTASCG